MICAKFDWNWPSGSGEEDENVKSLRQRQRQRQQRRRTTDKFWSEKLTWAFGSGELKMNLQWFRFDITLCEKLDFSVKDKIITVLKSSNKLALFMDIWKFKNLLLQNYWASFKQTWHNAFLGEGDSSLFKWRPSYFQGEIIANYRK